MIKAKKGKCKIEGRGIEIMAEFCGIVNSLKAAGVTDRIIDKCVAIGKLSPDELKEKGDAVWEEVDKAFNNAL